MGQSLGKQKDKFSADDINGLNRALFELFDSYDLKDWKRLRNNLTPTLMVDYTEIGKEKYGDLAVEDYMKIIESPTFLGDPLTKTQHLVGATWYERVSSVEAIGHHQIRAAHMVYTDDTFTTEKLKGHAHATNVHYYKKVNGVWKFHGIRPKVHSSEFDFAAVWAREPVEDDKLKAKDYAEVAVDATPK